MTLKRNVGESVHAYTTRFNSIYNALPPHMKPPQGMALAKYPVGLMLTWPMSLGIKSTTHWKTCRKEQ